MRNLAKLTFKRIVFTNQVPISFETQICLNANNTNLKKFQKFAQALLRTVLNCLCIPYNRLMHLVSNAQSSKYVDDHWRNVYRRKDAKMMGRKRLTFGAKTTVTSRWLSWLPRV